MLEGHCGLSQQSHSGLETMGILGNSDAMQQLFEESRDSSQENTVSSFVISIGNELHHQGLLRNSRKALIF